MVMMMLDLGTTLAVWGIALAIIPFLDVIIDWFCIGVPALRSPATRMRVLHDSLTSTRALLEKNQRELEAAEIEADFNWRSKWAEFVSFHHLTDHTYVIDCSHPEYRQQPISSKSWSRAAAGSDIQWHICYAALGQ